MKKINIALLNAVNLFMRWRVFLSKESMKDFQPFDTNNKE